MIAWIVFSLAFFHCNAENLTVAGLFSIFDSNNNLDRVQLEHLAAFKLAIDEINSNPNILPGHFLDYAIDIGSNIEDVAQAASTISQADNISLAVSSLVDAFQSVSMKVLAKHSVFSINSIARGTEFGDPVEYPYHGQTIPGQSFEGMVLQKLLCSLNMTRIMIYRSDNLFGSRYSLELLDATYCVIEALVTETVFSWADIDEEVGTGLDSGATVFVMLLESGLQTIDLITKGRKRGLFDANSQIFTHSVLSDMDVSGVDPDVLRGVVTVSYFPDYSMLFTEVGRNFSTNWHNMSPFGDCNTVVDSQGATYLKNKDTGACVDLDFAAYRDGNETLNAYAGHTYDAAYAAAYALDYLVRNNIPITIENVKDAVVEHLDFPGASGQIDVFEGMTDFDGIGFGGRETGVFFNVLNYHAVSSQFAVTSLINIEDGMLPCRAEMTYCVDLVLSNLDNEWPSAYPPFAFDGAPEIVKIGGLFAAILEDGGEIDVVQAELLAAFIMAINELNNKTDGIADDLLPNTKLVIAVENNAHSVVLANAGIEYVTNAFYGTGVSLVINALSDTAVESVNGIAVESELFQIYTIAMDTILGNGLVYKYKAATVPIKSFFGMSLQRMLCYLDISKIASISMTSEFGEKAMLELFDETFCPLDGLARARFLAGTIDFRDQLLRVKRSGARIIVVAADAESTAMILKQGRELGVFKEGVQVFTSEHADVIPFFDAETDIPEVMKGVISLEFWADYSVQFTALGQEFRSRFENQNNDFAYCENYERDSNGNNYLYRSTTHAGCADLNFAEYQVGNASLNPFAAHTYDAVFGAAYGIDYMIRNSIPLTVKNIRTAMFDQVDFYGASGHIDFFEGMSEFAQYGQGNRESGMHFRVMNFNADAYASNASTPFVTIGVLTTENGLSECPAEADCSSAVYDHPHNKMTSDTHPSVVLNLGNGPKNFFLTFGSVTVVVCGVYLAFVYTERKHKEMVNAQVPLLYLVLFGGVLASARCMLGAFDLTGAICTAQIWTGHLAFFFVLFPLFMRTWRVNKILNNKGITRERVTNKDMFKKIGIALSCILVYLVLMTFVGGPHVSEDSTVSQNEETKVPYCSYDHPEVEMVLFAAEVSLVVTMMIFCHAVKDIPEKYSDFRQTTVALVGVVVIIIVVAPLMYLVGLGHLEKDPIPSVAIAAGALFVVTTILAPRVYAVKAKKKIKARQVSGEYTGSSTSVNRKSKDATEKMTVDEKFQLYTEKIAFYTQLRILLEEERNSSRSGIGRPSGSRHSRGGSEHNSVSVSYAKNLAPVDEADAVDATATTSRMTGHQGVVEIVEF